MSREGVADAIAFCINRNNFQLNAIRWKVSIFLTQHCFCKLQRRNVMGVKKINDEGVIRIRIESAKREIHKLLLQN